LVNRRGKTVILATNLLEEAWEMCDRIIVLRAGEIVATGSPSELGRMAMERRHFAIVVDRADDALLRRTRAVPGLVDVLTVPDEEGVCLRVELDSDSRTLTKLLHAVSSNGVSIAAVREEAHPAQIFAALTGFSNDIQ
jgi:ABC-2 type transport system ATP-binding protein